ncbi:MAG TPA: TetR/AcrR family transcriptional regulator [Gaiellaceae bacterium]
MTRRPYHSPRREAQAAATRREILDAAAKLFAEQGYPATTMGAIAKEAGVALKTVYVGFETKGGVLRALWNRTLRGDEEVPVADQPWFREALDDPDPERQLRLNARNSRLGKERLGVVGQVVRAAAPTDPEIAALWERIQDNYRENQRAIVESVAAKGALRAGLDVERATDALWALNNPDVWHLLVGLRGWTAVEYERWCADTAVSQLLG